MKPFVVYIDVNTDKVTLSKEDFEKYLKEVYEQGHDEGYNKGLACNRSNWWNNPNWWNSPQITTNEFRYGTASPSEPNPITITCDNDRNSILNKTISNTLNAVGDK